MELADIVPYVNVSSYTEIWSKSDESKNILIDSDTKLELESRFSYNLLFRNGVVGYSLHNHIYKISFYCWENMTISLWDLMDPDYIFNNLLDKISFTYFSYRKDQGSSVNFKLHNAIISKNLDELFEILEIKLEVMRGLLNYDELISDTIVSLTNNMARKICESDPERYGYLELEE